MSLPRVTILTVTFNAMDFLEVFFNSIGTSNQHGLDVEILMVDNGSSDGSVNWVREHCRQVRILENDENNYARALNLGIASSQGDYVVIANNDATVDSEWLQGFFDIFRTDKNVGAVQSKILFSENKKINSVGVEEIGQFYFRDIGFEGEDSPRYANAAERKYVTGGSVMFRRQCLEDVGDWDEDFIMFVEDMDYSIRCRKAGWKLWYSPSSILFHQYHGSSSEKLCDFFCTRNRFLFVAKHFPLELPGCIETSHCYEAGQYDLLYRSLLHSMRKMCTYHDTDTVTMVLRALKECLPGYIGACSAYTFFSQLEVILGLRKIRVGIYDHAGHFAGGGQRYVAEMAAILQDRYDVTYIFNNDVQLSDFKDWFDIDLTPSAMKIIKIPFFEERGCYTPNESMVVNEVENPFDIISWESLNYDIFINANMLGKVNPLSAVSLFVCHFPDQEKENFFQVDRYDHLIVNSDYTGGWVKKRWQLNPSDKLYPPVNMYNPGSRSNEKHNIILSVSRFEVSGSKKQIELVRTFSEMCVHYPVQTRGWKLVLVGGSTPDNMYLGSLKEAIAEAQCPIELVVNAAVSEIKEWYRVAAVFWHACGLDEIQPERVEHFGMTTVEAMQNYCVPVVIDGGGQKEIVEHEYSGYRFSSLDDLKIYSLTLIGDEGRRKTMAECAFERSHLFSKDVFKIKFEKLLAQLELELSGKDSLPGAATNT